MGAPSRLSLHRRLIHMTRDQVIAELQRELHLLQPALTALDEVPALEQAVVDAQRAEHEWQESRERPWGGSAPDHRGIELNGVTNEARDRLERVQRAGRDARRRANEVRALLRAPEEFERCKAEYAAVRAEETALRERADKATCLVQGIAAEVDRLEERRIVLIDQGAEERLAGKADTSTKALAQIEAQLTIERRALEGAQRKFEGAKQQVDEWPERLRQASVALRRAAAKSAELDWRAARAAALQAATRYIATQQLAGYFAEEVRLQPRRHEVGEIVRELEAELFGARQAVDDEAAREVA